VKPTKNNKALLHCLMLTVCLRTAHKRVNESA